MAFGFGVALTSNVVTIPARRGLSLTLMSMNLIRRPGNSRQSLLPGCAASIGVFDGLHLGHQLILSRLLDKAAAQSLPSLVFSFEPTPKEYFIAGAPPARLMRFREKFKALDAIGIDWFYCPRFEASLGSLEPDDFVEQLLVKLLRVRHLVVGDDFQFARERIGTTADLVSAGSRYGFTVEEIGSVVQDGVRVSSTAVREALSIGDLDRARQLLGHHYQMSGRVVEGQKLGKTLGFPTANLKLNRKLSPVSGIFAVRVAGLGADMRDGVASVGTRPTVGGKEVLLEVHIFDFDRDIYGHYMQVDFIAKLREEEHFPDLKSMQAQMCVDAAQAREILAAA